MPLFIQPIIISKPTKFLKTFSANFLSIFTRTKMIDTDSDNEVQNNYISKDVR